MKARKLALTLGLTLSLAGCSIHVGSSTESGQGSSAESSGGEAKPGKGHKSPEVVRVTPGKPAHDTGSNQGAGSGAGSSGDKPELGKPPQVPGAAPGTIAGAAGSGDDDKPGVDKPAQVPGASPGALAGAAGGDKGNGGQGAGSAGTGGQGQGGTGGGSAGGGAATPGVKVPPGSIISAAGGGSSSSGSASGGSSGTGANAGSSDASNGSTTGGNGSGASAGADTHGGTKPRKPQDVRDPVKDKPDNAFDRPARVDEEALREAVESDRKAGGGKPTTAEAKPGATAKPGASGKKDESKQGDGKKDTRGAAVATVPTNKGASDDARPSTATVKVSGDKGSLTKALDAAKPSATAAIAAVGESCSAFSRKVEAGGRVRLKVSGIPDGAQVLLDGKPLDVVQRTAAAWVAQLGKDAASGKLSLKLGDKSWSCGKLEITSK